MYNLSLINTLGYAVSRVFSEGSQRVNRTTLQAKRVLDSTDGATDGIAPTTMRRTDGPGKMAAAAQLMDEFDRVNRIKENRSI